MAQRPVVGALRINENLADEDERRGGHAVVGRSGRRRNDVGEGRREKELTCVERRGGIGSLAFLDELVFQQLRWT